MKITITIDRGGLATEFGGELARGLAKLAVRAFDDIFRRDDPEMAAAAATEREERIAKHRVIADFVGMMREAARRVSAEPANPEPANPEDAPNPNAPDRQAELIARRVAMRANLRDLGFCPCMECTEYALTDRHAGVSADGKIRPQFEHEAVSPAAAASAAELAHGAMAQAAQS